MSYTIHYVELVRSSERPYYCPAPSLPSSRLGQGIITSIRKKEQALSIQKQITLGGSRHPMNNISATFEESLGIDDAETRKKIWRMFFNNKPLPQVKPDAIDKYYGALDKYVNWKKIDLKKLKGKIEKFLDE